MMIAEEVLTPKKRVIYSDEAYESQEYVDDLRKMLIEQEQEEIDAERVRVRDSIDAALEDLLGEYFDGKIERYEISEGIISAIGDAGGYSARPASVSDERVMAIAYDDAARDLSCELECLSGTLGDAKLFAVGSPGRWDGPVHGWQVYEDLDSALYSICGNCEDREIWDENGRLMVAGWHHDGENRFELRMLTEEGLDLFEAWLDDPSEKSRDIGEKLRNPENSLPPRHAEKAFGCPAEEFLPTFTLLEPLEAGEKALVLWHSRDAETTAATLRHGMVIREPDGFDGDSPEDMRFATDKVRSLVGQITGVTDARGLEGLLPEALEQGRWEQLTQDALLERHGFAAPRESFLLNRKMMEERREAKEPCPQKPAKASRPAAQKPPRAR